MGSLEQKQSFSKDPCPNAKKWNMTMDERVKMWKASKHVNTEKPVKNLMPHQLLKLYTKPKPKRIRGTVNRSFNNEEIEKICQVNIEILKKSDEFHKCNFCYKQFAFKSTMYKHQVSHQINSKPITPYQYLPIDEPNIDLQEFMEDEENDDWDVTDLWQSLRAEEAAMEKYINKKK